MGKLRQNENITSGVIWKQLLLFFFPLLFGMFFQQLYNTVDAVVVGRIVGKAALAAVGATGVIVGLLIGIFTGLSSGAVVVIAQHFGARRGEEVHRAVHTAMLLSLIAGVIFTVVGFLLTPWALRAMDTPPDTLEDAILYLRIYFLGMIPNLVYNMGTGVLRAIGDSKRPFYFLVVASLCNIVLDIVFVLWLHMGVAGAAIATILSQLLSAVLVVWSLLRSDGECYQLFPASLRMDRREFGAMMKVGVPTALQSVMYSASNILIQAVINGFGTDAVAAWTAYGKMDVIFWMFLSAMAQALTTFAGQNYGAGKYDRVRRSIWVAAGMCLAFTIPICILMYLFARPAMAIFTPDEGVLEIGVEMVRFLVPAYFTYIMVELLPGAIRGAGKSVGPMVITVFGVCVLRFLWLFLAVPRWHTLIMVEASYPITWTVTAIALLLYYRFSGWLPAENAAEPLENA